MATKFITHFIDSVPLPTCDIPMIIARTDKPCVWCSLSCSTGADADTFFSTSLHPFNGVVELEDVGRLIEQYFREKRYVTAPITCILDGESLSFTALYCEVAVPYFDIDNTFLVSALTQIVHPGSAFTLPPPADGSLEYKLKAVGLGSNGSISAIERDIIGTAYYGTALFAVDSLIGLAMNPGAEDHLSKVHYFAISSGGAQKIFYVVNDPFYLTFRFRNVFNVLELLDVVGTVKQKTEVTRESAVCSGINLQYDRKVRRTYEITTGALTANEARAIEQLVMSSSVSLGNHSILITDHTIEQDNDDSSLCSIKFTFRFAADRVQFTSVDLDAFAPARTSIFTDEFSDEFA